MLLKIGYGTHVHQVHPGEASEGHLRRHLRQHPLAVLQLFQDLHVRSISPTSGGWIPLKFAFFDDQGGGPYGSRD